jgi:hypothetical protein
MPKNREPLNNTEHNHNKYGLLFNRFQKERIFNLVVCFVTAELW